MEIHVDEIAMKVLLQAKGPERVRLDQRRHSRYWHADGKYKLGGYRRHGVNGVCRDADGKLAGSTLTLDRALRNIVALGVPLANAVRMLTLNPATILGIEFKKGALRTGADADILLLNEALQVTRVWNARNFQLAWGLLVGDFRYYSISKHVPRGSCGDSIALRACFPFFARKLLATTQTLRSHQVLFRKARRGIDQTEHFYNPLNFVQIAQRMVHCRDYINRRISCRLLPLLRGQFCPS